MTQIPHDVVMEGGLDLVTPAKRIRPGRLIGAKNYEPNDEGGYRRILGYERYDGFPSPSEATYWILDFDDGDGTEVVAGNIITGADSAATAEVLSITTASGTWGVDAVGEMRLFNLTGTFEDDEDLEVSATKACLANGVATLRGETVAATDETYMRAAREARRADISKVPGADEINGTWLYNGVVYAFREGPGTNTVTATTISFTAPDTIADSGSGFGGFSVGERILISGATDAGNNKEWTILTASATTLTVSRVDETLIQTESAGASVTIGQVDQTKMWKSSAAGWVQVGLGHYLDFSAGSATFTEGATVTGSPSTATGTVVGIGVTSGTWAGSDAAGRVYIAVLSGTFTASDTLADDGTVPAVANCDSGQVAVTLPRGGKYEFSNYNFYGSLGTLSMWGVNGVGRGFRYNSTTGFTHVHVTGLTNALDVPEHLEPHRKHLFYSIGPSLQHSSVGAPMIWNAITGAAELATGDTIVAIENQKAEIMGVFNRNRTYMMYGSNVLDWDVRDYSLKRGAIEWSVQNMGVSVYCDDRGVYKIGTGTDVHGDLQTDALSAIVDPFFQESKSLIVDSVQIKTKSQYRYFNSDNSGLLMRIEGTKIEFCPFEYDHRVYSICAEEDSTGLERVFFGSDDGYVYEAEKGESFDGEVITFNMRPAFCHCKTPRMKKRFHSAHVEIEGPDDPGLTFSPDFSYGSSDQPTPYVAQAANTTGGLWGVDLWEQFVWDGAIVGEYVAYIPGRGHNISLLMQGSTNYEAVHTVKGITFNFSKAGVKRG